MRTKKYSMLKKKKYSKLHTKKKNFLGGGCLTKKCKEKKKQKESRLAEMEGESQSLKDELKAQIESIAKAETDIESAKTDRDKLKKIVEDTKTWKKKTGEKTIFISS